MITKVWLKLNLFKLTLWKKFILTWGNFWWFVGMMYILLYSSMWLCPEWYYTFSNEQKYSFIEHDLHQITYAVASKRPLKWTEQFLPRRSGKPAIADHFCFTQSHFLWQSLKKLKVAKKNMYIFLAITARWKADSLETFACTAVLKEKPAINDHHTWPARSKRPAEGMALGLQWWYFTAGSSAWVMENCWPVYLPASGCSRTMDRILFSLVFSNSDLWAASIGGCPFFSWRQKVNHGAFVWSGWTNSRSLFTKLTYSQV